MTWLVVCLLAAEPAEPQWVNVPARWPVQSAYRTAREVFERVPPHQRFSDARLATRVHEDLHQVASLLRQAHGGTGRVNAVYVGGDRAAIVAEPPGVTLAQVAQRVPVSMRGMAYQLYLVQQQRWWQREPCYVLDEWAAYHAAARLGVESAGAEAAASDLQQTVEMAVYSLVLSATAERATGYDATQLRALVSWIVAATNATYAASPASMRDARQAAYLARWREADDARWLREYLGRLTAARTPARATYRPWAIYRPGTGSFPTGPGVRAAASL